MQKLQHGPYALLDYSRDHYPLIEQGSKEDLEAQLKRLREKDPMNPDRYEIMPFEVYELAWGFEMDERFL